MANIIIYTDFDGTVTGKPGGDTVFTKFYQSLLVGYLKNKVQDYRLTPMKDINTVLSLFEKRFGSFNENFNYQHKDAGFLMSSAAVAFFHEALKNENVVINIVTKNRFDYIQAIFRFHDFSEKEISKINIMDSGHKYRDVNENLKCHKERASKIYVLDDSKQDYNEMMDAVQARGYQTAQIHGDNQEPGQFNWFKYQQDIMAFSALKKGDHIALLNEPEIKARINVVIQTLEDKIGKSERHCYPTAFTQANLLLQKLKLAANILEDKLRTPEVDKEKAIKEFKVKCQEAIDEAKPGLGRDLGWGDFLTNLLKAIYNVVAQSVSSNPNALFTLKRPVSICAVEDAEKVLGTERINSPI